MKKSRNIAKVISIIAILSLALLLTSCGGGGGGSSSSDGGGTSGIYIPVTQGRRPLVKIMQQTWPPNHTQTAVWEMQ